MWTQAKIRRKPRSVKWARKTGLDVEITRLVSVEGGQNNAGTLGGASIVIIYEAKVLNGTARPRDDADAVCWYAADDPLPEIAFESTRKMLAAWIGAQRV
jgi:ADP-ribose pyrophosphatase YjhB (NUDIX family)